IVITDRNKSSGKLRMRLCRIQVAIAVGVKEAKLLFIPIGSTCSIYRGAYHEFMVLKVPVELDGCAIHQLVYLVVGEYCGRGALNMTWCPKTSTIDKYGIPIWFIEVKSKVGGTPDGYAVDLISGRRYN